MQEFTNYFNDLNDALEFLGKSEQFDFIESVDYEDFSEEELISLANKRFNEVYQTAYQQLCEADYDEVDLYAMDPEDVIYAYMNTSHLDDEDDSSLMHPNESLEEFLEHENFGL